MNAPPKTHTSPDMSDSHEGKAECGGETDLPKTPECWNHHNPATVATSPGLFNTLLIILTSIGVEINKKTQGEENGK